MNQDNNTTTPVLTLEPFAEAANTVVKEPQAPDMDVWTSPQQDTRVQEARNIAPEPPVQLTPEEQKMINDFAAQIDLKDSNVVLQYGAGAQKKIADFSEGALNHVKTKDLGEIGDMLTGVVRELKSFEPEEENKGGFFGLFKRGSDKIDNMKSRYDKAKTIVDKIFNALENHQLQLLKDVAVLDKMYELNTTYFKE